MNGLKIKRQNMKYIKAFESFDYSQTNEGWLFGEGSIFSKIINWYQGWKDQNLTKGAEKVKEYFRNNPHELEDLKLEITPELRGLSEGDRLKIISKLEGYGGQESPSSDVVAAATALSRTQIDKSSPLISEGLGDGAGESLIYQIAVFLGFREISNFAVVLRIISIVLVIISPLMFFVPGVSFAEATAGLIGAVVYTLAILFLTGEIEGTHF